MADFFTHFSCLLDVGTPDHAVRALDLYQAFMPMRTSRHFCAAADGNLALMECADTTTGETRYVICAVGQDGTDFLFTPFGHLAEGNPFDAYLPPSEALPDPSPT